MNPTGLLGAALLVGLAWLMSENRRAFPLRLVLGGVCLQLALAVILMKFGPAVAVFRFIAELIAGVISMADEGIAFIFGPDLGDPGGPWGFVFVVKVLPVIIYFAALMSVLYYLGIMQKIVGALAWLLRRSLGVSGPEALAMAANVFVGQTEAPLCIKPYLATMSRAGLMTLMVGGFATIAGSVLAGYVNFLAAGGTDAEKAVWIRHLLTASVMSAPAAFVMARVLVPETAPAASPAPDAPAPTAEAPPSEQDEAANVLDAAAIGAGDGLRLALNVAAMLIAFVSLLALVNWPIRALGEIEAVSEWLAVRGVETLNIQTILGWVFSPLAWTMGVEWADAGFVGRLMGEKIVATEFIAFGTLAEAANPAAMVAGDGAAAAPTISPRSAAIAAFALCGFANFGSIGIQIGGLSALAPTRRKEFVSLAMRAMIGGAFASWMTASIAGLFL